MAGLDSVLDVLTAVVGRPTCEVSWGVPFFMEYPVHHRAVS